VKPRYPLVDDLARTVTLANSILLGSVLGSAVLLVPAAATAADAMAPAAQRQLIDDYCMSCHNYADNAGGLELEIFDPASPLDDAKISEKVIRKLRAGMMPPAGEKRPDFQTIQQLTSAMEHTIDASAKHNLSVPKLHRLNRTEYANAVRDLLGLDLDSTKFLPSDDASRGFDNQAGTLTLSPALLEAYLSAAARISRLALGTAASPTQVTYRIAEDTTQNYHVEGLPFGTRGGLEIDHTFPSDGTYTFKVFSVNLGNMGNFRPFGEIRGEQLLIYLDGKRVAQVDWDRALGVDRRFDDEGGGQLKTIDVPLPVSAGPHKVAVTFLATNYAPGLDLNKAFDRSTIETGGLPGFTFYPHIGSVRVDGPDNASTAKDSPSRQKILSCVPKQPGEEESCARAIATRLARNAYRGYSTSRNVDELMKFYALGRKDGSFEDGVEAIVQRVLVDPKFVYRTESTPADQPAGSSYAVNDLDLASRLSFFLWSSIPDETLLSLAEKRQLTNPDVLLKQVRRMLDDPRASALTANFASQWLGLRSLASHAPVVDQFPDFDDNLRQAFRRETELLFQSLLAENRSVTDLLTADYTFVNERLAKHYGIPGIRGSEFRRVKLDASQSARRGLLGKGAVLTVSSQPGRTSPVIRGQWVLKNIIGVPAPDPPADVPDLPAKAADAAGNAKQPSLRALLEEHRRNPACQGCHKLMDPIGFSLEPFDAVGRFRTEDAGNPINARDQMYDGTPVNGPEDVRAFLLKYQDQYLRHVTQNLLTYALGRGMEYDDMPVVRSVLQSASASGYKLRGLIEAVAMSDIFRSNVAEGASDPMGATSQKTAAVTPAPLLPAGAH
jgi:hypothetical protein